MLLFPGAVMRVPTLLPSAALVAALLLGCAGRPERCWVCQREIHSQVRAVLTLANGKEVTACCPRCALHYREEPGNRVREIQVTDYAGHRSLPLSRAYLVEGSDETPCLHHHVPVMDDSRTPMRVCYDRCMPSLVAFASADAARTFMKEHGGILYGPGELPSPPKTP
jgi:hypothetical protein